jgi:DNA-nicking Smr family endonuclease
MSFKIGDQVSILDEKGVSKVVGLKTSVLIEIEDEHGFERTIESDKLCLIHSFDFGIIPDISKDEEKEFSEKKKIDFTQPKKRHTSNWNGFSYIDLHIEELEEDHLRLPVQEILQIQLSRFRTFLKKCEKQGERKCYIIHGVGEGVLRAEIHLYLHRLPNVTYDDARSKEFGEMGATEVLFIY